MLLAWVAVQKTQIDFLIEEKETSFEDMDLGAAESGQVVVTGRVRLDVVGVKSEKKNCQ